MLLSAVGVTDAAVAADYALSEHCLRPLYDAGRRLGRPAAAGVPIDADASPPETMLALLDELRDERGGAAAYLRAGGLAESDLARLAARLVG